MASLINGGVTYKFILPEMDDSGELSRAKQSGADQSRAEQSRPEQSRAERSRAKQSRTERWKQSREDPGELGGGGMLPIY